MSQDIEHKIQRIATRLLPDTPYHQVYGTPAALPDRMKHYHTPGVSVAVIHQYELEWARGFGIQEAGAPAPITERTLFQAGSISKPVFALAVMRLVREGRLDLDEDVNRYLKSWQIPANGSWQPRVTLRQLLSHSAGLTVHGFPGYARTADIPSNVQILNGEPPSNTAAVQVNLLPGLQARYSGGGTTVGQRLVMDVMGQPFPEIMQDWVLGPLGMQASTYEQPLPESLHEYAATAHPWMNTPVTGKWHVYPEMAAAGLWSTPSDLARLGIQLQLALKGESSLFTADTILDMLTPQVEEHVGIGFFLEGKGETARFGHGGSDEGFESRLILYKHLGMGAVIMVNSNEGRPLIAEIERAIAQEYGWPDYFPARKIDSSMVPERLEACAGTFATSSGHTVRITPHTDDNLLQLQLNDQPPIELFPESATQFFATAVNLELTFETSDEGAVTALVLQQGGKRFSAARV